MRTSWPASWNLTFFQSQTWFSAVSSFHISPSVSSSLKVSSLLYPPVPPNAPTSPLTYNVLRVTLYVSVQSSTVFQHSFSSSSDAHSISRDLSFSCATRLPRASVPTSIPGYALHPCWSWQHCPVWLLWIAPCSAPGSFVCAHTRCPVIVCFGCFLFALGLV